jgi:hypothetical protein
LRTPEDGEDAARAVGDGDRETRPIRGQCGIGDERLDFGGGELDRGGRVRGKGDRRLPIERDLDETAGRIGCKGELERRRIEQLRVGGDSRYKEAHVGREVFALDYQDLAGMRGRVVRDWIAAGVKNSGTDHAIAHVCVQRRLGLQTQRKNDNQARAFH